MFTSTIVFEKNRYDVSREPEFNRLLEILTEIRDFLNELGYLSMGRDMLLSCKLDAPAPCRLDAPDFSFVCHVLADCLHQH